jgi:hypothetical protein
MANDTTNQVDSIAVKGIAAKVQEVLAAPGTLLSFPLQPIAYADQDLRFLSPGGLTTTQSQTLAEFSELVNRLPLASQVWRDDGSGRHLWDVYAEMLGAELADSERTPAEQAAYQQAYSYLRLPGPDGLDHPSPVLTGYQACQSAYLTALSAYKTGQGGSDADALKAASDMAWREWKLSGHKDDVEAAMLTLLTLGDKDPSVVWSRYRMQFDPTEPTAYQTAPNGMRYATTGFAPSGVMDVPWVRMSMSRDELMAAASGASAELASALGDDGSAGTVQEISFDFTAVDVMRAWFDKAMFESRGWRLRDGGGLLSDGSTPPAGSCPAFVTKVVFARNISVTRTRPGGGKQPPTVAFIDPVRTRLNKDRITDFPILVAEPPESFRVVQFNALRAEPTSLMANLKPEAGLKMSPVLRANLPPIVKSLPNVPSRTLRQDIDTVQRFDFPVRQLPIEPKPPVVLDPPPPGNEVVTTPPEFVFIMAFQCQLLGSTPNPDPSLPWPAG